jgi:DNA invertase Pin-like site-specific DNA recombinase
VSDLRAAVYCRLSGSTGNANDPVAHLQRIAAFRGWRVVASIVEQPTATASTRSDHPALDALLRDTNFDVLMVESLSHLASTLPDLIRLVNELRNDGADLLACDDDIDTTVATGKSAFTVFAALAAFEHTMICERARISLDQARRNGVRLGRPSNLNESVRAAIHALHRRGASIRSIARQLKVGNATIYKALQAVTTPASPGGSPSFGNGFRSPQKPLARMRNEAPV